LGGIEFPECQNLTSVCFGGEGLRDLYVTSARTGKPGTQKSQAGCLFVVRDLKSHLDGAPVHGLKANEVDRKVIEAARKK